MLIAHGEFHAEKRAFNFYNSGHGHSEIEKFMSELTERANRCKLSRSSGVASEPKNQPRNLQVSEVTLPFFNYLDHRMT